MGRGINSNILARLEKEKYNIILGLRDQYIEADLESMINFIMLFDAILEHLKKLTTEPMN